MSITVRDCLKLPSLSLGRVIAGHGGLDNIVSTVSVLEFDDPAENEDGPEYDLIALNELLISAFFCVRNDVDAQCSLIRKSKRWGDIGLVLFYSDIILGALDKRLIETADMLDFPIILLPEKNMGLKYSDVINDVMEAIFYDRRMKNHFVTSAIERLSQTAEEKRTPSLALSLASDYGRASFFLCDESYHIIASSYWPMNNYEDLDIVKEVFSVLNLNGVAQIEEQHRISFFRTPFTERKQNRLILCAVSHHNKLNSAIMSEVAELIQLFTALWNYNLNITSKEAIIPALFDGQKELSDHICRSTGIDKNLYNRVLILESEGFKGRNTEYEDAFSALLPEIRSLFHEAACPLICDMLGNHIVLLYHTDTQPRSQLLEAELGDFLSKNEAISTCTLWTCERLFELAPEFYREYSEGRQILRKIYPRKKLFTAEDVHYASKIRRLCQSLDHEKERCLQILEPVLSDHDPDLIKTLACYLLDADSVLKKTSELMFVHRNTVLYRLNRIRTLLGCDLAKMPAAYDIYMAVSLYRLELSAEDA